MAATTQTPATLDDLYKVEGKAELIGGEIVHFMSSGHRPSRVALKIATSLDSYSTQTGLGVVYGDGIGFALTTPLANGRQSFSPDASYYDGPLPLNEMRFTPGTPTFAVEVRSENDYGKSAEAEMEAKRADYFESGTIIVWDVDPKARTVSSYRGDPSNPVAVYHSGQMAQAEPAVKGWTMPVDAMFA